MPNGCPRHWGRNPMSTTCPVPYRTSSAAGGATTDLGNRRTWELSSRPLQLPGVKLVEEVEHLAVVFGIAGLLEGLDDQE